jgi:hypothetical protein
MNDTLRGLQRTQSGIRERNRPQSSIQASCSFEYDVERFPDL